MNTAKRSKVLILGTSAVEEELATSFRHLGYEVQLGTFAQGAPGNMTPDITVAGEGTDLTKLRELVDTSGCELFPTVEACRMTRNREGVRRTAAEELGLPTMAYKFVDSVEDLESCAEQVGYPLVVKPGRSTAGEGQSVVRESSELGEAFAKAQTACGPEGESEPVAVEQYIDFDYEVTILTARSIDPATGELATWFCEPIGTRHEDGKLVETWQPAALSQAAADNARSIAARISGAIAGRGVYSIELFVDGDEVYFSQATPRPDADGLLTRVTQRVNQFDLHARATAGLPIDATLTSPGAAAFLHGVNPSTAQIARAMAVDETSVQVHGNTAMALCTADTVEQARARAAEAITFLAPEGE
ncbi:phosphoribosylglycinamide formyltransferase [Corynebacterium hadale]|uniref:Phosphoribosylglycinamide formyltransferase n=1 Tax=Corynebacterium hadale TaxID=2026255 RepID=A0AB36RNW6_9CORY|nr:ATP-grasp domain-containing protein [Corynebacterium hadale]PAT11200.1 phosphoribosylglycinamide formyltransferase [Corynebacterium hadale]